MKRKLVTSAAACGICLGVVAPTTIAPAFASPVADGIAYDGPSVSSDHDVLGTYVPGADGDTLVVVVPGTNDDRSPRINGILAGRDSLIVNYPESFWPIISGKSGKLLPVLSPTYDKSRGIATDNTLTLMEALQGSDRVIVYTGYSQGSDALGNAAEQAAKNGLLGPDSTILLVSDPRGPWGVKSKLSHTPLATPLLALIGVTNDGARDPGDTGDTKVVHVIVQGDPVAHTQWDPLRPLSSVLVNAAGFVTIHSATGPNTYARLDNLEHTKTLVSEDGNSTYEIYDTYHPLALLNAMIFETFGLPVSQAQMEAWDRSAEAFYPTQEITADNADPKAKVREVALTPDAPQADATHPGSSQPVVDEGGTPGQADYTPGTRRLIDPATGDWAEPTPLPGGTPSDGPRHQAPGADDDAPAPAPSVGDPEPQPTDDGAELGGADTTGGDATGGDATGGSDAGSVDSGSGDSGSVDAGSGDAGVGEADAA